MAFSGGAGLGGPRGGGGRGGNGNRGFAAGRAPLPHGPGNHGGGRGGRQRGAGNRGGGGRHGAGARGPHVPAYLDPSQLLSGKALQQGAHAIANAQTQGPISMLAQQIASNNQTSANQQQTDFGYYMQLAQAAKNAVSQQQQINQGLTSQLQGIGQQTQQQLGALGQQAQGGAVGRMNALGLGGDSQQQLQDLTNQQKGLAAQNAQTYQQAGATQGANYQSMAYSQQGVTGLAGTEQIGNLARANALNNQKLNQQIGALQATRGADYATALGQLRTAERNYQVAQEGIAGRNFATRASLATNKARIGAELRSQNVSLANERLRSKTSLAEANARVRLGTKVLAARQQQNAAENAIREQSLAQTRQNELADQAYHQAELAARQHPNQSQKPLTTYENNRFNQQINEIIAAIQTWRQDGMKNSKGVVTVAHPTEQQMRQVLNGSYRDVQTEAAFELLGWGALLPQTAKLLHNMGVRGTTFRGRPVGIRNPHGGLPNPPNIPTF